MKTMISGKPFHPFVFGVFYILSIYQTNADHQPLRVVMLPLIGMVAAVFLILLFSVAWTKNIRRGALYSSLLILLLLIFPFIQDSVLQGTGYEPNIWLFLIFLFLGHVLLRKAGVERQQSPKLARALNTIGLCCLLPPLFTIMGARTGEIAGKNFSGQNAAMENWTVSTERAGPDHEFAPDIIHIVLDGYARGDVLERLYSFDNEPFLSELRERGFHVIDQAAANYCQTGLSMASSLNAHYLDLPSVFEESSDRRILKVLIQQGSVPAFLQNIGYSVRLYDSGYYLTDSMGGAQVIHTADSIFNEFTYEVIRKTLLWMPMTQRDALMVRLGGKLYQKHKSRILNSLDMLKKEPVQSAGPTYTFAHLITPHPPFIFSYDDGLVQHKPQQPYSVDDGSHRIKQLPGGKNEYQQRYIDQLEAVNEMILPVMQDILANAERPLVVILQSDHGPGSGLDWDEVLKSDAQERLAILGAIYFSDGQYDDLYENITPVNFWRVILNKYYLSGSMPLLDDRSYLSSWPRPYAFHEVVNP